jgi:pyridoxine 5'-phosphate synthase PdxJ
MRLPCRECLVKPICISKSKQQESLVFVVCVLLQNYLSEAIAIIDADGNHIELSRRIDAARTELRTGGYPHPLFKNPFLSEEER